MAEVIVLGGGLAGLAAAAALGPSGHRVRLFEARPCVGGRATSYESGGETIDNCQHVLLRCCVNLIDFYQRLGVADKIRWYDEFVFIEPGGRRGVMRGLAAIRRETRRVDLDQITMAQWLGEHRQPPRAIERFWRQILVSAISEELDRTAAAHAFQVFRLAFLATRDAYQMGVPSVPLGELYASEAWRNIGGVEMRLRAPVERIAIGSGAVRSIHAGGQEHRADYYVCALPFEKLAPLNLGIDVAGFTHAPITGIHLWFDRPVIDFPQATLLDRTIHGIFNKHQGRYVQLVVSASHSLIEMPRSDVIALALAELADFFPAVRAAKLEKAHVVKEVRAVLSPQPGLEKKRPAARTPYRNLFLAGDWTRTGWPAIMEGAVRSGYLAAEAVSEAAGSPQKYLRPDIA